MNSCNVEETCADMVNVETTGGTGRVEAAAGGWTSTPHVATPRFVSPEVELSPERVTRLEEVLLRQKDFPAATMGTEKEFEDWLDLMARYLREYIIPVNIFVKLWKRLASTRVLATLQRTLDQLGPNLNYGGLFDAYARNSFRGEYYVHSLQLEILSPQRRESTDDAWDHLRSLMDRYTRVTGRWSGGDAISDMSMCLVARKSVPQVVGQSVPIRSGETVWQYLQRCTDRERELKEYGGAREAFLAERPALRDMEEPAPPTVPGKAGQQERRGRPARVAETST